MAINRLEVAEINDASKDRTEWFSLAIAGFVTILRSFQMTIYYSLLWPYLLEIDPDTSESFYGFICTVGNISQAIAVLIFGKMSSSMGGKSKMPIILATVLVIIGNIVFIACPVLPMTPKYVMLISITLTGLGGGVISILRNYFAMASTEKDRSRAMSLNLVSFGLGILFAPVVQGIFTKVGYPGLQITSKFTLDMYSGPVLTAFFGNTISLLIVTKYFKESFVGIIIHNPAENGISKKLPNYDKIAIFVCMGTVFAQQFVLTNIDTVGRPFVMSMFSWSKKETVLYTSIMHGLFGGIGMVFYFLNVVFDFTSKASDRVITILALFGCVLFHLLTFSWYWLPGNLKTTTVNSTKEVLGCRPSYTWCDQVAPVNMWLFVLSFVLIVGISYPLISICVNPLFSKIIGPREQSFLTSLLMFSVCVAKIVVPIFVSYIFEKAGPRPVWLLEIIVCGTCSLLWLGFYKRMVPLRHND